MSMTTPRIQSSLCLSVLALACLALTGCGGDDSKSAATQVAAKVGSDEISVHQINDAMSHTNTAGATTQAVASLSREVLEKLIDQQLAVDQAIEDKLQRTPEVVNRLENARREILSQAFIQEIVSKLPKPTPEQIKAYYDAHPALFANRNIFNVLEITAENGPGAVDLLRSFAGNNKPPEEIAAALREKGIKFNGGAATRSAEQIPLDLLPKVQELKDGQALVLDTPKTVIYLRVVSRQPQPVTEETAGPRIAQFLNNQASNQAVSERIKKLRADTKIEYMGEFKKTAAEVAAAAAAAASAAAPAADASAPRTGLEKGIPGLK